MRTVGVKQSGNGTKKDDFRHRIAQRFEGLSQASVGEDRKKFGSVVWAIEVASQAT